MSSCRFLWRRAGAGWNCTIISRAEIRIVFIDVDDNFAARAEKRKQAAKRAGYVRTMLQPSHAENFVEGSFAQRDFINAGLKHERFGAPELFRQAASTARLR